jgi:hypothetical protein
MRTSITFSGIGEASIILAPDTEAERRLLACLEGKEASFVVHREHHNPYTYSSYDRHDERKVTQVQVVLRGGRELTDEESV